MHTSRRSLAFLFLATVALVAGLATGRDLWFTLAYVLGLLLVLSFIWAWVNITYVHIARLTRSRRTQVGQPMEERFTVRNTSWVPKLWLEVRDVSTLPGHHISRVVHNIRPRGSFTWRTTTISRVRGRYQLGPLQLRSSDPFGLFPMQRDIQATTSLVVYPYTVEVHQFGLPMGLLPGGDALRRRSLYPTTNASGVRDYAPGDSFGRIHWRSTARRDRLITKEFELDPLADIWIVPDMARFEHTGQIEEAPPTMEQDPTRLAWRQVEAGRQFRLPHATEEYTVTVAASLAQFFLRQDRALGLAARGQTHEIVQPDRGERQLTRILETLAVLRAVGAMPLYAFMETEMHFFQRGATVIVVTPTTREDWVLHAREVMRRGLRLVTVLVNPASFGGPTSSEGLYALLQANGVLTYWINYGDNLSEVLSRGGKRLYVS